MENNNLKIEISLTDLWTESEQNMTEAIKEHVIHMCKQQIWESIKKETKETIEREVIKEITSQITQKVQTMVTEFATESKIKKKYSGGAEVTINDWILDEMQRMTLNGNYLADMVKRNADNLSTDLKKRFDLLFASQIVSRLHENGMLKEDVAKLLIDGK